MGKCIDFHTVIRRPTVTYGNVSSRQSSRLSPTCDDADINLREPSSATRGEPRRPKAVALGCALSCRVPYGSRYVHVEVRYRGQTAGAGRELLWYGTAVCTPYRRRIYARYLG